MQPRDSIKDWFFCSRAERNGIIILSCIILFVIVYRICLPMYLEKNREFFVPLPASFFKALEEPLGNSTGDYTREKGNKEDTGDSKSSELFFFDPNHLPMESWRKLGLSERQVVSVYKFEAAGGHFTAKEDVRKLYCVSPELYERWIPWILLPTRADLELQNQAGSTRENEEVSSTPLVDINRADTVALIRLRGVGKYFARKIIEYRDRLGGFSRINQLMEVWRMRPGLADTIAMQVTLDTTALSKMHINTISEDELKRHPYLTKRQAACIVAYRDKHGNFNTLFDIQKSALISDEEMEKIKMYIRMD